MKVNGTLQGFHREYRRRRMAAAATGQHFMPYKAAYARLQKILYRSAAARGWASDRTLRRQLLPRRSEMKT
jgi:hypothetical protein